MEESKSIYLIRHAKSDWEAPFQIDLDRPISERGKKNAKELRNFLHEKKINFDISYISHSKRTLETYSILKKENLFKEIKISKEVYEASPERLFELVKNTPDEKNSILFLGHNPDLEDFANELILRKNINSDFSLFQKFTTSAVICLNLKITSWKHIHTEAAKIQFFWTPTK